MSSVRIGFIGCGSHATQNLYPCLRYAPCELVAVADLYEERREYCKRVFGAQRAYDDGEKLLDQESLDAVFICGPADVHQRFALSAMRRGLHVFTDKPPAPSLVGAIELRDAARESGRICMVGLMKRFAQKYVLAKQLAEGEEFGSLTHVLVRYSYAVSMDLHETLVGVSIHAVDLALHFLGDIRCVQVLRGEGPGDGVLNLAVNLLGSNGATGTVIMNNVAAAVTERVELTGHGAHIVIDEVAGLAYYPPAEGPWRAPRRIVYEPNFPLQTRENSALELQGYAGEVVAFVEAVEAGHAPACATIEDAVRTMRVLEAIEACPRGERAIESE
jgi:myo-inositol 2-dehydrogenase / D-chiro-inositol 1-dehydrogenase